MFKTREQIRALAVRRYADLDGVRFRSLTDDELETLQGVWGQRYAALPDVPEGEWNQGSFEVVKLSRRELIALTMVDENGERIFGDNEIDEIGKFEKPLVDKWHEFAEKHCGLADVEKKDKEVNSLEKKSDSTAD